MVSIRTVSNVMPNSVRHPVSSVPVQTLDGLRPTPAKATLDRPVRSIAMTTVVKDALAVHYGKLEVAAREMGDMDPSQLSRELQNGKFRFERLDQLDAAGKAAVSNALQVAFGKPDDPKARARRLIAEAKARLDQLIEEIAS